MLETDPEIAENCTGTFLDYHGPIDGLPPEGAHLLQCTGCGEIIMIHNNNRKVLIPGTRKEGFDDLS